MLFAQAEENRTAGGFGDGVQSEATSTVPSRANTEEWPTTHLLPEESERYGDTDVEDNNDPLHELRGPSLDEDDGDDFALFALDSNPKRHSVGPLVLEAFGSPENTMKRRSGVPPLISMKELSESPLPFIEAEPEVGASTPEFLRMTFDDDSERF